MEIFDDRTELRATISKEGEVRNVEGTLVGFINDDGNAGDSNEMFLGEVSRAGQVIDNKDQILAKVDLGTAEVANADGGHYFTVSYGGEVRDALDGLKAKISNFNFHKLKVIVAYVFFFDCVLVDPRKTSKILIEKVMNTVTAEQTNTLRIREGEQSDVRVLAPLNIGGDLQFLDRVIGEIQEFVNKRNILVAVIGNQQVGYLLWEETCLGRKDTWYLDQVVVRVQNRKQGIASELIKHLLGIVKAHRTAKRVLSMVQPENSASINLHTKNGFQMSGSIYLRENDLRVLFINQVLQK